MQNQCRARHLFQQLKIKPVIDARLKFLISGYDANARLIEEEDSACPTLLEHDFNKFHHTIPGLRRSGVDANAIRQVSKVKKKKTGKFCDSF